MKKRHGRGCFVTGFFLPAVPATRLFPVSLLVCHWRFWSTRRWRTSGAVSLVSLAVVFSLEKKINYIPFIFMFCCGVAVTVCRWNIAGTFFCRWLLATKCLWVVAGKNKTLVVSNYSVPNYGLNFAFLWFNRSKYNNFGIQIQTKKKRRYLGHGHGRSHGGNPAVSQLPLSRLCFKLSKYKEICSKSSKKIEMWGTSSVVPILRNVESQIFSQKKFSF